jgi:hypothetical protein
MELWTCEHGADTCTGEQELNFEGIAQLIPDGGEIAGQHTISCTRLRNYALVKAFGLCSWPWLVKRKKYDVAK